MRERQEAVASSAFRRMLRITAVLLATVGTERADIVGYRADPVKAQWSAWVRHGDTLSQIVVCNFDSLSYVELSADADGNGGAYQMDVWLDGTEIMWSNGTQTRNENWVRFENWNKQVGFSRGKQYEFRLTRSGPDSTRIYYDESNPYKYGEVSADGAQLSPVLQTTTDLCARIYGRMNPVSNVWRACVNHWSDPKPDSGGLLALARAKSIGICWIRDDFSTWPMWLGWPAAVMGAYHRYVDTFGFRLSGILSYGRHDTASTYPRRGATISDAQLYPPRNLYSPVTDTRNVWAGYCRSIMDSMPEVKYWEIWPEANAPWYWRNPDTEYYKGSTPGPKGDSWIDTWRERCSLYVRMCAVAESAARALGGGRKIIGGAPYRLLDTDSDLMSGVDWLWNVFDLAERRYGGVANCFDILSVHPYMHYPGWRLDFWENRFRRNLDTARWVMRQAGYPQMELWATEYGWPRWNENDTLDLTPYTDALAQADNVGKFLVSAIASQSGPRGGYDRAMHYELTAFRTSPGRRRLAGGYGFLDTTSVTQPPLPQGWAFSQVGDMLAGRRLNGMVLAGDTGVDNHTRIYEFEDTTALERRTWVCWEDGDMKKSVRVKLPVRTDQLAAESLAYSSTTPILTPRVAGDGWVLLDLSTRPAFIHEVGPAERPDIKVDSVRYERSSRSARAWATNHGTAATPVRSGRRNYPTWAVLKADGDSVAQAVWTKSIGIDQEAEFKFELGKIVLPDTVLLSVTVNPDQTFVELETDDNTGYTLKVEP